MKQISRIRWFSTTSEFKRIFGVSVQLHNLQVKRCVNGLYDDKSPFNVPANENSMGDTGLKIPACKVVNALLALPGVLRVQTGRYEFRVTLAPVYDWEDVHERIVSIIKEQLFHPETTVSVEEGGQRRSTDDPYVD